MSPQSILWTTILRGNVIDVTGLLVVFTVMCRHPYSSWKRPENSWIRFDLTTTFRLLICGYVPSFGVILG